jgi:hypothetical protein
MRASSTSSTDERSPEISGYRIEREIRRAATMAVYEAIQVELERRVVLTVLAGDDPRAQHFRASAWPEHRHVVSLYAVGAGEHGLHIATRFVPGAQTLAQRIAAGDDATSWLADVREALAATGAVHGALADEQSLLVDRDDHVWVTGFGLARPGATAADDEQALALLERVAASSAARRPIARPSRRRRATTLAAVAAVGAAVVIATGGEDAKPAPAPAIAPGLVALGSALAAGPAVTVDCDGRQPSGRSQACTAMQTALAGRTLVAPRDGVVRAWHVRGARGEVALRVIRRRGTRFVMAGGSDYERVDGGLHSFHVELTIRRGDRVGLELAPGSAGGFRDAVPHATTTRFVAALRYAMPRTPNPSPGTGRAEELLLRADYAPGQAVGPPDRLTGAAAERAPDGREVDEREIDIAGGRTVTVAAVALPGGVALDVLRGTRRRARIDVPGADPAGRLVVFTPGGEPDVTLAWRNPDGRRIEASYRVTATSIAPLD